MPPGDGDTKVEEDFQATPWGGAQQFATLAEVARAAEAALDPPAWHFLSGGAGDQLTMDANQRAFTRWQFRPRTLTGIERPVTTTTFLDLELSMPILTAPFGFDALFHPEGHRAVARANEAAGTVMIVPEVSQFALEEVAATAPAAARVFQLVPVGDVDNFVALVQRAADAGYAAVCVTVDTAMPGWREQSMEDRFMPDPALILGNYPPAPGVDNLATFRALMSFERPVWTWPELADACARTPLPWIAKGVLGAEDARAAADAGAAGIFVSNHGGRQLDGAPAALDALVEVLAEVGDEVEVGLDGGIWRGSDVAKALALGARVVGVGKAAAMGLAAGGEDGVRRVLELLQLELVTTLALLGRGTVAALDRGAIEPVPGWTKEGT